MSQPRIATAVILTRGEDTAREVYLVKRSIKLKAFAGQWAFPGGTVDEVDKEHSGPEQHTLLRCAVREILEETGILPGLDTTKLEQVNTLRQALLANSECEDWATTINAIDVAALGFTPVCEITTPPIAKIRFKTQFLHIALANTAAPNIIPGELDEGRFLTATEAIRQWENGSMEISPPVLMLLRLMPNKTLAEFIQLAEELADGFAQGLLHPAYFSPGIFLAALHTPTLLPATTTNTMIIGSQDLYIVDPATPDADEQARLFAKLDAEIAAGKTLKAILLTHHHPDHVGAVNAVSQAYDIPVRAHAETYNRIEPGYKKGTPLTDGEIIPLGQAPDGSDNWQLEALHTPGHAVDHFCFLENRYGAALVGDMLSTISTILIDPPEGHMRTYLDSLQRLLDRDINALFPAHGHVHSNGSVLIREYLQHRADREQVVIAKLTSKSQSLSELVTSIYSDVPKEMHAIASRSLLAGLIKLQEDGVCEEQANGWSVIRC